MTYKETIRRGLIAGLFGSFALAAVVSSASAQDAKTTKVTKDSKDKPAVEKTEKSSSTGGRDPFRKIEPVRSKNAAKSAPTVLAPPTIQERIERYRAQKLAAASSHIAAPKPTTALLLSETQVIGVFRTPRGWAAMIEATPIKLSYVIYPGENLFDAQLVAIEENRLVFRRQTVWSDGRREVAQEVKPLRTPSVADAMSAAAANQAAAPATTPSPTPEKTGTPEKQ